jgi:steroid delta-isomerase-like uncharacterized protein
MEEHKALFRAFVEEIFHRGNLDALHRFFRADAVIHDPGVELTGPAALRPALRGMLAAFPDLRITLEDEIFAEDRLAVRYRGDATHLGAWRGIPASGRRISYTGILIVKFKDGQIAEYWAQPDLLGLLQQMGAIEVKIQPVAEPAPVQV